MYATKIFYYAIVFEKEQYIIQKDKHHICTTNHGVLLLTSLDDFFWNGAIERIRTPDLRITNAPLYQLSYDGKSHEEIIYIKDIISI
jgi:hypothetical protein